jgi:hypothetical protein
MLCALFAAGCPAQEPAPPAPAEREAVSAHDACPAVAELARLDPRAPVPLQPMMAWHQKQNMMAHLVAIQRVTDGLARPDAPSTGAASLPGRAHRRWPCRACRGDL